MSRERQEYVEALALAAQNGWRAPGREWRDIQPLVEVGRSSRPLPAAFEAWLDAERDREVAGMALAYSTGWPSLDRMLGGGLERGALYVVTSGTGMGKSTWASDLAVTTAGAVDTLLCSFELTVAECVQKLARQVTGQDPLRLSFAARRALVPELERHGSRLHVCQHHGRMAMDRLRDLLRGHVQVHGTRVVVLDHLHFFLGGKASEARETIEDAMPILKGWAVENGLAVVLVVHPHELPDGQAPTLSDLHGSSAIKKVASAVVRLHRERGTGAERVGQPVECRVLKVRSDRGHEGTCWLGFDVDRLRYAEIPRPMRAGNGRASHGRDGKAAASGEGGF